MIQQNRIQNERTRKSGGRSPEYGCVAMCGDGIKPAYETHEVKWKRRGVSFLSLMYALLPISRFREHWMNTASEYSLTE